MGYFLNSNPLLGSPGPKYEPGGEGVAAHPVGQTAHPVVVNHIKISKPDRSLALFPHNVIAYDTI